MSASVRERIQAASMIVARVVIGFVFLYAGFSKAIRPAAEFAAAIDAYQILPSTWIPFTARVLPWVELYTGVFILAGFLSKWAFIVARLLFGAFLLIFVTSFLRGIQPPSCGCFGSGLSFTIAQALAIDFGLLILAMVALRPKDSKWSVDEWIAKG